MVPRRGGRRNVRNGNAFGEDLSGPMRSSPGDRQKGSGVVEFPLIVVKRRRI
jgi:hypothetical protein